MKPVLIILLVATALKDVTCETYCYSDDLEHAQKTHFSTKTAYQFVKGLDAAKLANVPNCSPVKIWFLIRHGTRLPDADDIEKFSLLEDYRDLITKADNISQLCAGDKKLIHSWVLDKNITTKYAAYLTDQGWNDLKLLATDFQKIYPSLLPKQYDAEKYFFRHTDTQRTQASYRAFTEGLFGPNVYENIHLAAIPKVDTLLAPFSNCKAYEDQSLKFGEVGSELDKFQGSELMKRTLKSISQRLGFTVDLSYKEVASIFNICRFEQAWFIDKPSAWCSAFNMTEIEVLEYLEDMDHQYKTGYLGPLNENLPCEAVQDMLKQLNNDDEPHAIAYFSHSELLQLFLVALGAYKDSTLMKSDNYDLMSDRKWRSSLLTPFAANIVVAKYNCTQSNHEKVVVFLNQKPLDLEWCNQGLCEWSDFLTKYNRFYHADCSELFCTENSTSMLKASFLVMFVVIYWIGFL